ncbi:hypothetical protein KHW15_10245 [Pseudomonas syringae]|uniref:hypothetical protein n=1 Tax=Pseudomonas syringae TaxID=317 RepID=UPI001BCED925|nr:hypothetical protein [Pseudomonas syringae]MBS7426460.1 hypothetical protein [Pseudomonas syringae]MBS7432473.1 hypothetical protein [Pseudomonas syringae]QVI82415.1 hypothetical protein KHW15_10245 [Pseudomonas syringae]
MALHLLSSSDIHISCRQRIESCELWLRRIIHDKLKADFGDDYINAAEVSGQPVFSNATRQRVQNYISASPNQYSRPIDTLLFDDLGAAVGKNDVYQKYFRDVLGEEFSMGAQQIRDVVKSLVPIRNALSHANAGTLSLHDAERALCYCSDLISPIKKYYSKMNAQDKFPAPVFTRFSDSMGTVWHPNPPSDHRSITEPLYLGDEVRFEVEVDSTFLPSEYTVTWMVCNVPPTLAEKGEGTSFRLKMANHHVGTRFGLQVMLKSNKEWHRMQNMDAYLTMDYEVLPVPR